MMTHLNKNNKAWVHKNSGEPIKTYIIRLLHMLPINLQLLYDNKKLYKI